MISRYDSLMARVTSTFIAPAIQVYAFYVIAHGHYSPGGGFQGGVMLAASTVLLRFVLGSEEGYRRFPPRRAALVATLGVLCFALIGTVPLLRGGAFLDYGMLPIVGAGEALRRYIGILLVEVSIGFAVWGSLVVIFDALTAPGNGADEGGRS